MALQERAEVHRRPELRAAYVSMAVAREYVARRIRDPEDRERFLARLEEVVAASAAQAPPTARVRAGRASGPEQDREPEPPVR